MSTKVLVTGGTGLVGSAIKHIIREESSSNESWIFCSSKDADLWYFFVEIISITSINYN